MAFAGRDAAPPPPLRRRATAVALALAAHLLIAWLLLRIVPPLFVPVAPPDSFTLLPDRPAGADTTPQEKARRAPARTRAAARATPSRTPPPPPRPEAVAPPPTPPVETRDPMLRLFGRKDLFEAGDVSRMRRDPGEGTAVAEADGGGDSAAPYGPGEGPGGKRLYAAEWQVEPTDSQLSPYVRPNAPRPGWGIVACQTVDGYRVENCRQIGESPVGSGYAAAVRQAAWQFRVRPPRVGGKSMVGAWVRIRIDYTIGGMEAR